MTHGPAPTCFKRQGGGIFPSHILSHDRQVVRPALLSSCLWKHLTWNPTSRASSTVLPRWVAGPVLPNTAADNMLGQLSYLPQAVRVWEEHLSRSCHPMANEKGRSPMLISRLICTPLNRVTSTVLLKQDAGLTFTSATVSEGLGQFSCLPQVSRGKGWGSNTVFFNTSFIQSSYVLGSDPFP